MVEKTQNTSFGNTEENTNDEPENQANIEQKAVLQKYLNALVSNVSTTLYLLKKKNLTQ